MFGFALIKKKDLKKLKSDLATSRSVEAHLYKERDKHRTNEQELTKRSVELIERRTELTSEVKDLKEQVDNLVDLILSVEEDLKVKTTTKKVILQKISNHTNFKK